MDTPFDVALLRDAVLWVEKEAQRPVTERQWDQSVWTGAATAGIHQDDTGVNVCGSAYCLAGHLVVQAGLTTSGKETIYWSPEINEATGDFEGSIEVSFTAEHLNILAMEQRWIGAFYGDNPVPDWDIAAMLLLGIDADEARELFAGDNDVEAIRAIATRIAHDHGEVL